MCIQVLELNKALKINNISVEEFIDIGLKGKCGVNINLYLKLPANTPVYSMNAQPTFGLIGDDLASSRVSEKVESNIRLLRLSSITINNLALYQKTTQSTFDAGLAEEISDNASPPKLVETTPGSKRIYGLFNKDLIASISQRTTIEFINGRPASRKPVQPIDIDILSDQLYIESNFLSAVKAYLDNDDIYLRAKARFGFLGVLDNGCKHFRQPENKYTKSDAIAFFRKNSIEKTNADRMAHFLNNNPKSKKTNYNHTEDTYQIIKDNPHLTLPVAAIASLCIKAIKDPGILESSRVVNKLEATGFSKTRVIPAIVNSLKQFK